MRNLRINDDHYSSSSYSYGVMDPQKPAAKPEVVTKVEMDDILLGRGALAIGNQGNVAFRNLIRTRKVEYMSTNRRRKKDIIANEVRAEIARRNGRFIRKVMEDDEAFEALGLQKGAEAWVVADEETVMQKIKQSLRDRESESTTKSAPEAAVSPKFEDNPNTRESKRAKVERGDQALIQHSGQQVNLLSFQGLAMRPLPQHTGVGAQIRSQFQGRGIDTRLLASAGLQGQQLPLSGSLNPQQNLSSSGQMGALLDQMRSVQQESDRQFLIQRLEAERNASLLRLQQQEALLAVLRGQQTAAQQPAGGSSSVQQTTVPSTLQALLQVHNSGHGSVLEARPATEREFSSTTTSSDEDQKLPTKSTNSGGSKPT